MSAPVVLEAHIRTLAPQPGSRYDFQIIGPLTVRSLAFRIALGVIPLCACAAVLGIDDGHPRIDASITEDAAAGAEDGLNLAGRRRSDRK